MAAYPEDASPERWHRYFAVEGNNRGWELSELPSRTAGQTLEMLNAAHAAAWHWAVAGNELNHMRAKTLLAQAHVLAGFDESALGLAAEVREFFVSRDTEHWELAIVHAIHAHAAAKLGQTEQHRISYQASHDELGAITDPGDREVVLAILGQVPAP